MKESPETKTETKSAGEACAGCVSNSDVKTNKTNRVSVRWFDAYLEEFECTEVRFGSDILFLRLTNGQNRQIPLRQVRWFSMSEESHSSIK